eukprot:1439621-Pleurochrysis_carterae.AAC.2
MEGVFLEAKGAVQAIKAAHAMEGATRARSEGADRTRRDACAKQRQIGHRVHSTARLPHALSICAPSNVSSFGYTLCCNSEPKAPRAEQRRPARCPRTPEPPGHCGAATSPQRIGYACKPSFAR